MPPFKVSPLTKRGFGALIEGASFKTLMESGSDLRRAWFQYRGLLVLRLGSHQLSAQQLVELSRLFGQVETVVDSSKVDMEVAPENPEARGVIRIGNTAGPDGKSNAVRSKAQVLDMGKEDPLQYDTETHTPVWHTDSTYREKPPIGSVLYCVKPPEDGGGTTIFSDAMAAFEALPPKEQETLRSLDCLCSMTHHDSKIKRSNPLYPALLDDENRRANPTRRVPVVLRHPIVGRESLYGMNSSTYAVLPTGVSSSDGFDQAAIDCFELKGMEHDSVSRVWREKLLPFATAREFTTAVQWQPGDVALWDNRCTMHAATGFDMDRYSREMWRTTLVSDHPQAASDVCGAAA
uniref:TauD/TfdA-like domain-containing protein n=1 Tax=Chromera velia CCMP2878 TaxID=1169474 RepID=A0A0G4G171_9ALVE|eukprot:Cvel_19707.t1-p1 / transcript=Cvel_19707.t1 / gene=Cvel_19707 / organism=Chromera_velia_CCMP2878 / gene_product=Alpha-ketoglutarate-dependent taurine dioxygenase, putative / transcript_product=Alpha-ketoglutarate-dependent taurine dioxygenase, putative / location=Cvel_scaffold1720:34515-35558(+) / protein_length=348 / sequence_SO=supercontig / SO=protein_coding / is_pseudo=false